MNNEMQNNSAKDSSHSSSNSSNNNNSINQYTNNSNNNSSLMMNTPVQGGMSNMNPNMNPNMMNPTMMNGNFMMGPGAGGPNAAAFQQQQQQQAAAQAAQQQGVPAALIAAQQQMRQLNASQQPMQHSAQSAAQFQPQQFNGATQAGRNPPQPPSAASAQAQAIPPNRNDPVPSQQSMQQHIQHPYSQGTNFVPVRPDANGSTASTVPAAAAPAAAAQFPKTPGMSQGASSTASRHASVFRPGFSQAQAAAAQKPATAQQAQQAQQAAAAPPFAPYQMDPALLAQQQAQMQYLQQSQQPQSQSQQHPGQQAGQTPQMAQQMQLQMQMQLAAQQQEAAAQQQQQAVQQQQLAQFQQQQMLSTNPVVNLRKQISNFAIMKFLEFCEHTGIKAERDMSYWKRIVDEYFHDKSIFRYSIRNANDSRQFEFGAPLIPRFYRSIIESGVTRFEFIPNAIKIQVLSNGTAYLESSRALMRHWHSDDSYLTIYGTVRVIFNHQLKIEWFDFKTHHFTPGLDWNVITKLFQEKQDSASSDEKKTTSSSRAFENIDNMKKKIEVFKNMSQFGLQESVMRVMQVSDVMSHLKALMIYSTTQECSGPLDALNSFVKQNNNNNNQLSMLKKMQRQQQILKQRQDQQQQQQQQQSSQQQAQGQHQQQPSFKSTQDLSPTSTAPEKTDTRDDSPSPKSLAKNSPARQNASKNKTTTTGVKREAEDDLSPTSSASPLILPKTPKLDMSQSSLNKRRRISHEHERGPNNTIANNSNGRKNTAVSPKSVGPTTKSPSLTRKKSNK